MTQYLVTIHRPEGYDPFSEGDDMALAIDLLNEEMITAGIRVFVGGLQQPETARSLRFKPDGTVTVSQGLYLGGKEHVGGLWVLEAEDLDQALMWGRKAAVACRASVEVRPFHSMPE